eukprot:542529_1
MINTVQIGHSEIPIRDIFEISLDLIVHSINEKWTRILQIGNSPKQKVPALEFEKNSTMLLFRISDEKFGSPFKRGMGVSYQKEGEASSLPTMKLLLHDMYHIKVTINQTHIVIVINNTNIFTHTKHAHWRNIYPLSIKFCGAGSIENCANVTIMNLNVTSYDNYCIHYGFNCDNYNAVNIDKIYSGMNFSTVNVSTYPSPTKSAIFIEEITSKNVTRGNVVDYIDIKNKIFYDFYFTINRLQNYHTNILHIGDEHHNFGHFQMHGLHLIYFINTIDDKRIRHDIEYPFGINKLYHIQLKYTQEDIVIVVNDYLIVNESLSGPQRHKTKDHVAVFMCCYHMGCSDVDIFNFSIISTNNISNQTPMVIVNSNTKIKELYEKHTNSTTDNNKVHTILYTLSIAAIVMVCIFGGLYGWIMYGMKKTAQFIDGLMYDTDDDSLSMFGFEHCEHSDDQDISAERSQNDIELD